MELNVESDENLLDAIDRAARFQSWVAQARRNAVIHELFEVEFDSDFTRSRSIASETLSANPAVEVE